MISDSEAAYASKEREIVAAEAAADDGKAMAHPATGEEKPHVARANYKKQVQDLEKERDFLLKQLEDASQANSTPPPTNADNFTELVSALTQAISTIPRPGGGKSEASDVSPQFDISEKMNAIGFGDWSPIEWPTGDQLAFVREKMKKSKGFLAFDLRDRVWQPFDSSFSPPDEVDQLCPTSTTIETLSAEVARAKAKKADAKKWFTGTQAVLLIFRAGLACHVLGALNVFGGWGSFTFYIISLLSGCFDKTVSIMTEADTLFRRHCQHLCDLSLPANLITEVSRCLPGMIKKAEETCAKRSIEKMKEKEKSDNKRPRAGKGQNGSSQHGGTRAPHINYNNRKNFHGGYQGGYRNNNYPGSYQGNSQYKDLGYGKIKSEKTIPT